MGNKSNEDRLNSVRDAIRANAGCRPGRIARLLGLDNKAVQRALAQLEERGDLLAEDSRGRLYWYDDKRDSQSTS